MDNILLENNVRYASDVIAEIVFVLDNVNANARMILNGKYDDVMHSIETSLYREITYNIEHTVHHLAIINIALKQNFKYVETSENFGYSSSTIQQLKLQKTG